MEDLIKRLSEAYGPSGAEEGIREMIQGEIEDCVDEMRVDTMGNLIARKKVGEGPRVMIAAHMDEIGLIVTHVDEKGFLRVAPVGGVHPLYVSACTFVFQDGVVATAGVEPVKDGKIPSMDKMYLDVGAPNKKECPVSVGDVAVYQVPFQSQCGRWIGKSMDDRIGCAILVQLLKEISSGASELFAVFTVQEELGCRGAVTSAFGVDPQIALAVDVTRTGDVPECQPMEVSLGKGPAVKVKDSGMIAHPEVRKRLVELAEEKQIPYQLEVLTAGATDAMSMQLTKEGVPAGCLSIPSRYVHQPGQIVDASDSRNAVELLKAFLEKPPCQG